MVLITIVTGAYKPTYNWGASHCSNGISLRNGAFSDHHCHFFTGVPQFGITKFI